jgi:hypothetical protein
MLHRIGITILHVVAECDDTRIPSGGVDLQNRRRFESGNEWHRDIQENDVWAPFTRDGKGSRGIR